MKDIKKDYDKYCDAQVIAVMDMLLKYHLMMRDLNPKKKKK